MQLAEPQTGVGTCRTADATSVRLRIKCPDVPDQSVELCRGKTTIGSSPRCNLRIDQPGVHPVHLLIVNDGGRLTARRWAADVLLNGAAFEEAPLSHGDRLSIGAVVLEISNTNPSLATDLASDHCEQKSGSRHDNASRRDRFECESGVETHPSADVQDPTLSQFDEIEDSLARAIDPGPAEAQAAGNPPRSRRRSVRALLRRNRNECRRLTARVEELECLLQAALAVWDAQQASHDGGHLDSGYAEPIQHGENRAAVQADVSEQSVDYARWQGGNQPGEKPGVSEPSGFDWSTVHRQSSNPTASEPFEQFAEQRPDSQNDFGSPWDDSAAVQPSVNPRIEGGSLEGEPQAVWPATASTGNFEPERDGTESGTPALDSATAPATSSESTGLVEKGAEQTAAAADEVVAFREFTIWKQGEAAHETGDDQRASEDTATGPTSARDRFGLPSQTSQSDWSRPAPSDSAEQSVQLQNESKLDIDSYHEESAAMSAAGPRTVPPPPAPNSNSFIDRYAHLFAEEAQSNDGLPLGSGARSDQSDVAIGMPKPVVAANLAADKPSAEGDEETIEQYMAKLLQRVRGGVVHTPTPTELQRPGQLHTASHNDPSDSTFSSEDTSQSVDGEREEVASSAGEEQVTTSLGTVRRKAAVVEQPASMEAFRALANESARRAISTHAQRIHRRNALTKTIVAILAGVTSVWLMLEAPGWRDVQFIAACVSLIVAAYWAGQTYGELIEAFRAASYDGPRTSAGDPDDPFRPALPIDVEG